MHRRFDRRCLALAALFPLCAGPAISEAQVPDSTAKADSEIKQYKCDKGYLRLGTEVRDNGLVAMVYDVTLYVLTVVPWKASDGPVVTWSDGIRTLTWSPDVVLRWKTATTHKICVNGVTHHRPADESARTQ
jgi:hypothetical protein